MDGLPLPHFLGLGAQKGGTTTLHRLLAQHPGVFLPPSKELHYFTLHYGQGASWYGSHFAAAGAEACRGDITPYYLFHPQVAQRIKALLPRARLIVLLRDPVERCLSQYFHARRLGFESLELEAALAAEATRLAGAERVLGSVDGRHLAHQEHSYLARSRYELQLARYGALFAPEQLLVLRSERLFAQPQQVWQQVLRFLELPPWPLPATAALVRANAGAGEASAVGLPLRQQLGEALAPTYRWLEQQGLGWVHGP